MRELMDDLESILDELTFGGGDAWGPEEMSLRAVGVAPEHLAYTLIDITGGEGMLVSLYSLGGQEVRIQIDGGPILRWEVGAYSVIPLFAGFRSSLKVSCKNNTLPRCVVLYGEGQWSQRQASVFAETTSAHEAYTWLDVQGSGVFVGISQRGSTTSHRFVFEADNSGDLWVLSFSMNAGTGGFLFAFPFKSRLKITSSLDSAHANFLLYHLD